jgi:hypothetical protein
MELTTASIKISKSIFSGRKTENVKPSERAKLDFEYVAKVKKKLSEVESNVARTLEPDNPPDCDRNSPDWPDCQHQSTEQILQILTETIPSFLPENASSSEKFEMVMEYLDEISKNPSMIVPLLS